VRAVRTIRAMDSLELHSLRHGELYIAEPSVVYGYERPTVYLDTTIPSYLTSKLSQDLVIARQQRMTHIWWKRHSVHCDLYVSKHVIAEAAGGSAAAAARRLEVVAALDVLGEDPRTGQLAEELIRRGHLPEKARVDAEHISVAAFHSIRFLLTWNCKHLANDAIARKAARTCEKFGYRCPEICTPENLMRAFAYERPLA
jgi:hypothetical protein